MGFAPGDEAVIADIHERDAFHGNAAFVLGQRIQIEGIRSSRFAAGWVEVHGVMLDDNCAIAFIAVKLRKPEPFVSPLKRVRRLIDL